MKKLIALMLCLAMVFALVACSAKTETKTETKAATEIADAGEIDLAKYAAEYGKEIDVVLWGTDKISDELTARGYWWTKFAEDFSAQYPNVTITYERFGGYEDTATKVRAAFTAGNAPTMWINEEASVQQFVKVAEDLRKYVPKATYEDWEEGLLISMRGPNGEIYGCPAARSCPILLCNETLLNDAGWSSSQIITNEDMFAAAKAVTEKTGKIGLIAFWDTDAWHWESAIYADGGQLLSDDGSKATFGKDYDYVGSKYVKQIQQGLIDGYVACPYGTESAENTRDNWFATGEAALVLRSCNGTKARLDAAEAAGYKTATMVQPKGAAGEYSIVSGGQNWVMNASANEAEKIFAGAFLAYVSQPEQFINITQNVGTMPYMKSMSDYPAFQEYLKDYSYMQTVLDSQPYMHARPNSKNWLEMYTYAFEKLEAFTLSPAETDVDAMIDEIEAKFNSIIIDSEW